MDKPSSLSDSEPSNAGPSKRILSSGGLVVGVLLALLLGLAYVVRSLKNVELTLNLNLKRDDRAEKKY